jgi:hypothetical protein
LSFKPMGFSIPHAKQWRELGCLIFIMIPDLDWSAALRPPIAG